ncbi:hypothetical protein [Sphingomonas oryzagri]
MTEAQSLYDNIYSAEVVRARVGHLPRTMREDIERVVGILREGFPTSGILDPKPRITCIMLVGSHARRCWTTDEESDAAPVFDFWVIVSDRLMTHRRLWQATEARIRDAVEARCSVTLSFASAAGLKAGKRMRDEYVCDRLATCITLYHAKRDDPLSRRGTGRKSWGRARACFDAAEAAFQPACEAFRLTEGVYYELRRAKASAMSEDEDHALQVQSGFDAARADQQRLGDARHEAVMALLHTPAPDLAAIIRKLELVRDEGDGDDHAIVSILADARRIAARIAACGQPL